MSDWKNVLKNPPQFTYEERYKDEWCRGFTSEVLATDGLLVCFGRFKCEKIIMMKKSGHSLV